ncbi:hypothetical protein CIG19_03485 [Enterobacterales bacterium CwR94]|nr:hypothetical protein CIG19_03485 [Enterobacterales bacterium CwR94]
MRTRSWALIFLVGLSASALAQPQHDRRGNTDVIVDLPPEAWTQNTDREAPCLRCCVFENRQYTEGAVVKSEGVLLQCVRDEKSLGTNNLIWRIVK